MDRYKFTNILDKGKYDITFYPKLEKSDSDIYIIANKWSRLDTLAYKYYNDVTLWPIIAKANNLSGDSLVINTPTRLRIPKNITIFLSGLEDENNS